MKKIIAALILIVIAGLGCGGNGDNNEKLLYLTYANNVFAGGWSGDWTDSNGKSGTATVGISTSGSISGSLRNSSTGETATIYSGLISNAGSAIMTYIFPTGGASAGTYSAAGTFSLNTAGNILSATLTIAQGSTTEGTMTFTLNKFYTPS